MSDLVINFENGNCIMPTKEMLFLGVGPGSLLPLKVDGDSITSSVASWSKEDLAEEIKAGLWFFLVKLPG